MSADVIHSFWIPKLAGKTDLIPGQMNLAWIEASEAGVYRGQCAEFCGLSHALMALDVIAMEPAAFDAWLADQRRPATSRGDGARLFAQNGCNACHTVRGAGPAGRDREGARRRGAPARRRGGHALRAHRQGRDRR